jgi:hypothetical protein
MSQGKQVAVGIAATILVIAISLGFVSLFSFPTFAGWVSFFLLCVIPIEIVASVTWGAQQPAFVGGLKQPAKGLAYVVLCLVAGAIIAPIQFATVGKSVGPPTPMLMMCTVVSVVIAFWLAIMWGGWPFTKLIKNAVAAGLTLLVVSYLLNYLLFRIFFSYEFMAGAPVYVPSLDPHGLFNAWLAQVFYLSALMMMFVVIHFDLWPLTKSPAMMQQPVLGIVWTILALALGGLAFYIGIGVLKMDPVAFMVRVPVPFIFGTIVVLNMMQGAMFSKLTQPVKGVVSTVVAAIIGSLLAMAYGLLAPVVTGALRPGPPSYDFEIWLASALLGVTFPFLIFHAEFFKLWPLKKTGC